MERNKKRTRGERVFFVMKLWTQKNTTLQGEGVGALALTSACEESTGVVLALGEDAGEEASEVTGVTDASEAGEVETSETVAGGATTEVVVDERSTTIGATTGS